MSCEGCKYRVTKLRRFMRWTPWCNLYQCAPEKRCADYKGK